MRNLITREELNKLWQQVDVIEIICLKNMKR